MSYHLQNYIRTYRRKAGLTQREVAFLAGVRNSAQVSRYEKCRRLPPLRTAFALEAILKIPLATLFAGIRDSVDHNTAERIDKFRTDLDANIHSKKQRRFIARKRYWLSEHESLREPFSVGPESNECHG